MNNCQEEKQVKRYGSKTAYHKKVCKKKLNNKKSFIGKMRFVGKNVGRNGDASSLFRGKENRHKQTKQIEEIDEKYDSGKSIANTSATF